MRENRGIYFAEWGRWRKMKADIGRRLRTPVGSFVACFWAALARRASFSN
ncbi:MAG: hypothetical protein ABR609_09990 [Acidimicrobiia bacterium]